MRKAHCLWSACFVWWLCVGSSVVVGQERHIFTVGGGISFSGTNSKPVSHGHAYLVAGEPGMVFSGLQDRQGKWHLNYLLLIKHHATAASTFERGDPHPAVSSASSDGKVRQLHFKERLRFDEAQMEYAYKAQFDAVKEVRLSEQMTVLGKSVDLKDGRVFLIDMTVQPVRYHQVNVKLPSSEQIDFLGSSDEQYQAFTKQWLAELGKDSAVIAKAFAP